MQNSVYFDGETCIQVYEDGENLVIAADDQVMSLHKDTWGLILAIAKDWVNGEE